MKSKKAEMEKDEHGNRYLTEKYIVALCEENQQYLTPRFNTCLYLHYKGFSRIQALENYTGLKSLWLEGNGLRAIENIEHLTGLRTLYLHQNIISKIEGMSTLNLLVTLNLSHNNLKVIENLGGCTSLKNLDLSHNMIVSHKDCEGLRDVPTITSIDLSHNYIEYKDDILDFFFEFQHFLCFYFKDNPAIRKIKMYRKTLINGLKNLVYLDERPVKEIDRLAAVAYAEGGFEKEKEVRKKYMDAQINRMRTHTQRTRELEEEGRKHRAKQIEMIKADTKAKKEKLLDRQSSLKEMIRAARSSLEEKSQIELELQVVEQELQRDMFDIINEDRIVVPPMRRVADQK